MDTIYAVSSGRVPAAIAVIRMSGPSSRFVIETLCGSVPEARRASLMSIRNRDGLVLDRGMVLWFPGPQSFTGEDSAEFQVHGSRAVIAALHSAFACFPGVRSAEPGEFTRRAFLAGKMDLTEVEGLADLLVAETEAQRRQAQEQSSGSLHRLYDSWRARLIRARALIEADLDFADEEDVPGSVVETAFEEIARLRSEIEVHLADANRGERLRDGFQVVLLGAPNAGKSSLLNALAARDVAIVTAEAGTTRDLLEVHLDIGGYPVTIVDTAGLRDGGGAIEREGMRRAIDRSHGADLVLWLEPRGDGPGAGPEATGAATETWVVESKCDLPGVPIVAAGEGDPVIRHRVSVVTGEGLFGLIEGLGEAVERAFGGEEGSVGRPSRERHRAGISDMLRLISSVEAVRGEGLEIVAECLRLASEDLGRLTGRIGVEDLLDEVFGSFCIGK